MLASILSTALSGHPVGCGQFLARGSDAAKQHSRAAWVIKPPGYSAAELCDGREGDEAQRQGGSPAQALSAANSETQGTEGARAGRSCWQRWLGQGSLSTVLWSERHRVHPSLFRDACCKAPGRPWGRGHVSGSPGTAAGCGGYSARARSVPRRVPWGCHLPGLAAPCADTLVHEDHEMALATFAGWWLPSAVHKKPQHAALLWSYHKIQVLRGHGDMKGVFLLLNGQLWLNPSPLPFHYIPMVSSFYLRWADWVNGLHLPRYFVFYASYIQEKSD